MGAPVLRAALVAMHTRRQGLKTTRGRGEHAAVPEVCVCVVCVLFACLSVFVRVPMCVYSCTCTYV